MINIDKLNLSESEIKNLCFLRTPINWRVVEDTREYEISADEIIKKLSNTYLRISCPEGCYLKIPFVKGKQIQYSSASDDNHFSNKLYVYENNPREYYIKLTDGMVSMRKNSNPLTKKMLINVLSETNDRVQKYGIILQLQYKNNGLLDAPNFQIEPSVAIHKLSESSILFNAIDITFGALVTYQVFMWIIKKNFEWNAIGYVEVAIIFSYIAQLVFRSTEIGNTFINYLVSLSVQFYRMVFKHSKIRLAKNKFNQRSFSNEIYSQFIKDSSRKTH